MTSSRTCTILAQKMYTTQPITVQPFLQEELRLAERCAKIVLNSQGQPWLWKGVHSALSPDLTLFWHSPFPRQPLLPQLPTSRRG